jgi:hypothetical protein
MLKNVVCDVCSFTNKPNIEICKQCGHPLTIQAALKMKSKKDIEFEAMKKKIDIMEKNFNAYELWKKKAAQEIKCLRRDVEKK